MVTSAILAAFVAGALGQTPKITSNNGNMELNALDGDVVFNTANGASATLTNIVSTLNNVPTDRANDISAAVTTASGSILGAVTSMTTPLSTAVAGQGIAIGAAAGRITTLENRADQLSTAVAVTIPLSTAVTAQGAAIGQATTRIATVETRTNVLAAQMATLMSTAAQYVSATAPCNAANNGRLKIANEQLMYCVGTTWKFSYHEPLGTSRGTAATDCQAIADAGDAPTSGVTTSWIEQYGSSGDDGLVYQVKCQFSTAGSTTTGISLGGDGSTDSQAGLNCATINGAGFWRKPAGVYYISLDTTMAATDEEDIARVYCSGGVQTNGDGSDYRAPVRSCTGVITQFEESLYENSTSQPTRFWQAISTGVNIAIMPNTVGPALGSMSSILHTGYHVGDANNGVADQGGGFVHGGGAGENWPRYSLQLAAEAAVVRVRLYLRTGTCASRNMLGTGCSFSSSSATFNGAGQGFMVIVGNEACTVGESQCPGTVCGWVRRTTSNSIYDVTCPAGTTGSYVHFQLPGDNRMITIGEMQVYASAAQQPCSGTTATGNGRAATTPGLSCRTIQLSTSPTPANGAFWVKPRQDMDAFRVYCDMRSYGGGWTIGEQWTGPLNNGQSYPMTGRNYADILGRGWNHGYYNGRRDSRSLGKQKINALWAVFGVHTMMRWSFGGTNNQARTCGDGIFQRLNVASDWDAFHSMRDTRSWDNNIGMLTSTAHWSYQYFTNATSGETDQNFRYYQERRSTDRNMACRTDGSTGPEYSAARNAIVGVAWSANMRLNQFEQLETSDNSGRAVSVSRHGVPGDPFEGCQWSFRFNSGRGQTWCRDDLSNYLMLK